MHDLLTAGKELTVVADLLVLVTGMVPRRNDELVGALKLPVGSDGFFNEIHPKLRPVETVVDGVLDRRRVPVPEDVGGKRRVRAGGRGAGGGRAQAGRRIELDPQVAIVDAVACDGCGECVTACPFGAI